MMRIAENIEAKWNLEIDLFERGKRRRWYQRTHNIVVNTGRQMVCESITPSALGPGSFTRTQNTVVRYIGFGLGGNRQNDPIATAPPLSSAYPAGYGGANAQTDSDVTVAKLERPIAVTAAPLWMQEIATPGTFPTAQSTTFIATFGQTDLNLGGFTSVPLSEIGLYKSSADPTLPNGSVGVYPATGGHLMAYDTFDPFSKTARFSIQVRWTFTLG